MEPDKFEPRLTGCRYQRRSSYSDPKQRHRYVRIGTRRKGRETPKGTPTLNAEAQLSSASFHLEPKRYGELHSQTNSTQGNVVFSQLPPSDLER